MFPPRTIRSIVTCALACGLLATTTSAAAAGPTDDVRAAAPTSSLAGTRSDTPRQDLRSPDTRDAASPQLQDLRSPDARDAADAERISRAMEQYYESYSEPKPATAPAAPAPNDSPWLVISVIAGALALMLASTALVLRHRRTATV